jgi:hypothetical protein
MNKIKLPEVRKLISIQDGNQIWQFYQKEFELEQYQIVGDNPFVIFCNGISYLLTSDCNFPAIEEYQYM